ncbi:MAG: hypothetical protein MUC97_15850 [Bernardetiaceae bacterium]|jgi:hypothetical protein|nr:hypothetical protein [Bernardetiaceae bacterium]
MKKLIWAFWLFCGLPALTACYEIREEVDIKKDGSGTYAMIIDMSQSKDLLEMAMAMSENKDKLPTSEIDSAFDKGTARFKNMPGISNAQPINQPKEFVFGMRFDFKDMAALNNALRQNPEQAAANNAPAPEVFKFSKRTLERTSLFHFKELNSLAELQKNPEDAEQMRALLQTATYACIVRVEGKIKKFSNEKAELAYTGKEVRFSAPLLDLIDGKANCANVVKFK